METTVLQQLKESIAQQRQNLVEWLNGTPEGIKQLRTGSAGEQAVHDHLRTLDSALKKAEEKTLGLCDVCHDYVETSRLEMDYTACVCIDHLTGKERSLLENDLELSQKVQRALLPQSVPEIRGLEIAAFSQPARIVGGDYFDFVRMKDGSHAIVIADVMGKGMPASMLMASLQASLRIIAPESVEPADVVARLNHLFNHNIRLTKFVTLFLARYDENSRVLTYCNAGHNPPLVHRANGSIEALLPTGAAIGLIEQTEFSQGTITLRPGDRMVLYTDGVVESMNAKEQLFGQERLEKLLRENPEISARNMIGTLKEQLQKFSGVSTPVDDTTVIAVSVTDNVPS
jgi:sigma-B regulation protein RsbU (phosphoserine phosphatase)